MRNNTKDQLILDALQELLAVRSLQFISVNDIARQAGIGKGSIYYYFPSKDAIMDALVERSYQKALETAKSLAAQNNISPFTRMEMIFHACRNSSFEFFKRRSHTRQTEDIPENMYENAYIHQRYMKYVIAELKPDLTTIFQQAIDSGDLRFDYPAELADMVLIILMVKLDNTLSPSDNPGIEQTLRALVTLLENGTDIPAEALNFLTQ